MIADGKDRAANHPVVVHELPLVLLQFIRLQQTRFAVLVVEALRKQNGLLVRDDALASRDGVLDNALRNNSSTTVQTHDDECCVESAEAITKNSRRSWYADVPIP